MKVPDFHNFQPLFIVLPPDTKMPPISVHVCNKYVSLNISKLVQCSEIAIFMNGEHKHLTITLTSEIVMLEMTNIKYSPAFVLDHRECYHSS